VYGALLFGGAHLRKRDSVWFPVVLLVTSDVILTNFIYHLNIGWMELFPEAAFGSIALVEVVTPACHRPTIFPGQLCVLPDQQLWRLVWLAKLSPDVGRTVRTLYRRHPLLWAYSRQYLAVRVGFVWSI
jgi:hypothetical protein